MKKQENEELIKLIEENPDVHRLFHLLGSILNRTPYDVNTGISIMIKELKYGNTNNDEKALYLERKWRNLFAHVRHNLKYSDNLSFSQQVEKAKEFLIMIEKNKVG